MFVSHDHNLPKKTFQKPNILRRKPKITSIRAGSCKLSGVQPAVHITTAGLKSQELDRLKTESATAPIRRSPQRLKLNINVEKNAAHTLPENNIISTVVNSFDGLANSTQDTVNLEAVLNSEQSTEFKTQNESSLAVVDPPTLWHIDFLNDSDKIIVEPYDGSQITSGCILPMTTMTTSCQQDVMHGGSVEGIQDDSLEDYTRSAKFKCDAPDCNKQFMTEQKLKRHKNTHKKHDKTSRHSTSECPVRKNDEGVEESCGRIFLVREELVKHLNEEHTLDDAPHRCEECGRRFFWASGLRAHGRAHRARRARAPLACAWPGCGRAFRQPCRLREHARAHTGDKPYPCRHPNCGWSFRTASKLLRHARRHTGERRHACACGRAFLRREHLREHQARHAPAARAPRLCPHDDCLSSFTNMSSLYLHMKKVHKKEEEKVTPKEEVTEVSTIALTDVENNMFMVSFVPESGEGDAETARVVSPERPEWHAARTHCTWPLAPRTPAYDDAYVLGDAHVEQSESSESNIFTVRSDLFLHGNVLQNEDSQQMGGGGQQSTGSGELALAAPASPLHADLGLLDTHSTIDLMQEELMYTDAAVDESPFQVLLLSGEELG